MDIAFLFDVLLLALLIALTGGMAVVWKQLDDIRRNLKGRIGRLERKLSQGRQRMDILDRQLRQFDRRLGQLREDCQDAIDEIIDEIFGDRGIKLLSERLHEVEEAAVSQEYRKKHSRQESTQQRTFQGSRYASGSHFSHVKEKTTNTASTRERIVEAYNQVINGDMEKGEFEHRFEPAALDIKNAEERYENPSIEPVFELTDGRSGLWAVEGDQYHLVVPVLGKIINYASRKDGAIDDLFQCGDYADGQRLQYDVDTLIKPALFSCTASGEWKVREKGRIELVKYQ